MEFLFEAVIPPVDKSCQCVISQHHTRMRRNMRYYCEGIRIEYLYIYVIAHMYVLPPAYVSRKRLLQCVAMRCSVLQCVAVCCSLFHPEEAPKIAQCLP